MSVACAACGVANPDTARFCGACGSPLARTCPSCGTPAEPEFRFCNACGSSLADPAGGSERAPVLPGGSVGLGPSAERRLVSVLFVDLVGFTRVSESLDAEEVRDVLDRYYESARRIVGRYDGSIEKFVGDAVMAVWGAPGAHEDDAPRAVRAGLEMLAAVAELATATGHDLRARAGVATGEAAVTLGAEGQGMVAGDLVNTASRLETAAAPGTLLVDRTTRQAAAGSVAFESDGVRELAGKRDPVAVWRAAGVSDSPLRGAVHGGPFIGRQAELRAVLDTLELTRLDPRCRLVSIIGIAGIGKSRLGWEIEQRATQRGLGFTWHASRSTSYGDRIAFAPLADLVRRELGLTAVEGAPVAGRRLDGPLRALVPDDAERAWLAPRVAVLVGDKAGLPDSRDELFAAWRRLLERLAERKPLAVLLEDLQWGDRDLIDFVQYMARWSRRQPIVFMTLARPELLDRRPDWGAGLRAFTALHLERLSDEEMEQLLAGLAVELSPAGRRAVKERADGVPLFAVEMVRMLQDSGRLTGEPGGAPLQLDSSDVPSTLHALIAARMDELEVAERALLLSASVLGQSFSRSTLLALAGGEQAAREAQLATLLRREFLTPDDDGSAPSDRLAFVQGLVRDVCYRTLSRRERRARHLAVAAHLSAGGDQTVDMRAGHLLAAHAAGRDEADQASLTEQAVAALRQAARVAASRGATGRSLEHFEQVLGLVPDSAADAGLRAELLEEAGSVARLAARFEVAESCLREAADLRLRLGDRTGAARNRARLAGVLLLGQRNATALRELEAAWSDIEDLEPDSSMAELAAQLGRAHLLQGDERAALVWAERAIQIGQRAGPVDATIDALITRGSAAWGDTEGNGRRQLQDAIEQAAAAGLVALELRGRNNLAWLVVADDPHATEESARRGLELAQRIGARDMELQLLSVATAAAIDTGNWAWAVAALDEALAGRLPAAYRLELAVNRTILAALRGEPRPAGLIADLEPLDPQTDPQLLGAVDYARAWAAFAGRDYGVAEEQAGAAAERALGTDRFNALALAARAALWSGDSEPTRTAVDKLLAVPAQGRAAEATRLTLRAGAAALAGDPAAGLYEQAVAAWQALDLPLQLALCLTESSRAPDSDLTAGRTAQPEAAEMLAALGARGLAVGVR